MAQSRKLSFAEATVSTLIGQVIAILLWMFLVAPEVAPAHADLRSAILINGLFMIVSCARSYLVRRAFSALDETPPPQ